MKKTVIGSSSHQIGTLFTFALVAVFAILALFLAVVGIEDYQSVLDIASLNNDVRVSIGYIANKIRTCDEAGNVEIFEINGQKLLRLRQVEGGDEYNSCIYFYEGTLCEQPYGQEDEEFMLEDGEALVSVKAFEIDMDEKGLVSISVTTEDEKVHGVKIAVRSLGRTGL